MTWWPFASLRELVEFLLLLATALLGFSGAPRWCIVGTTIGLYSFRWEKWQALGKRARKAAEALSWSAGEERLPETARLIVIAARRSDDLGRASG